METVEKSAAAVFGMLFVEFHSDIERPREIRCLVAAPHGGAMLILPIRSSGGRMMDGRDVRRPKVVLSGPVGAGKTTLARALGERLGVPVLPEGLGHLFQVLQAFGQAQTRGGTAAEVDSLRRRLTKAFFDWADERARLYAAANGFVADRWEADLLALWLRLFGHLPCDDDTKRLLSDMRAKAAKMSLAVFVPVGNFAVPLRNEDGLVRRGRFNLVLVSSLMTSGLIRACPGLRILWLPRTLGSVPARVDAVLRALADQPAAG